MMATEPAGSGHDGDRDYQRPQRTAVVPPDWKAQDLPYWVDQPLWLDPEEEARTLRAWRILGLLTRGQAT
jgi:hypothetical protein